jgi:uncharacterized DUF497 family protein
MNEAKMVYSIYKEGAVEFEFDPVKSASNLGKHGIDFVQAQELWSDPLLLVLTAHFEDEPRTLVIGQVSGKHYTAITTVRGDATRIISVRRSRKSEVNLYEGN